LVSGMNGTRSGRPLAVEIIGPAAAGKTSLLRVLCSTDDKIRAGLDIERLRSSSALVRKVGPFLPIWALRHRHDRWFNRREMKSITFLEVWYRELEQRGSTDVLAVVFDHGPLYRLARLKEFGPEITRSEPFERWWHDRRDRWMDALDLVVWLDASDKVLLQRVQDRGHKYLDATPSGEDKHEFLARYRGAIAEILEEGSADRRPRLLRFRSDQRSVGEIADEVLAAFAPEPTGTVPRERSR
jgi:hypothetical protein